MINVINMIPNAQSGETHQDSEPNLSVHPANPRLIAASAFTNNPMGGNTAPIYVSVDGGNTWVLNSIVPSQTMTSDISLAFGGGGQNLYAGILVRPDHLHMNILRTSNFTGAGAMTVLVDRWRIDQPFIRASGAYRGTGTGDDRVYVGNNDFGAAPQTATIDQSMDGAGATPPPPSNFTSVRIEARAAAGQDSPQIRPAVHIDGTVYGIFHGRRSTSGILRIGDIVVVRDDNWGLGASPFTDLVDPGDGVSGRIVLSNVSVPWFNANGLGQERVGGDLAIAIDPRDSDIVYIVWADRPTGTTNYNLHVRRSTDRGQNWSVADLRTIANATNPALAVNSRGKVAFLYQQLITNPDGSQRWVTRLELTDDNFATIDNNVLANVPAGTPAFTFMPYIGDYLDMQAVGKDFYGVFSANNTPNNANFPNGVTYQRNANFTTQTLFANDGTTPVAVSIDPFFFRAIELEAESDFYVADWTDSATSFDQGVEPSIRPAFFSTSDVWNRRSNAPGGFDANNRPINETPKNGFGVFGDNYAFARIRRRGTGTAESVTPHFLISEFGTGSNYQDAGTTADPTISFAATEDMKVMTNGYPWHLDATSSTHFCLAVEISTPNDPFVPPSLLGRAPGWPTTDLSFLHDNNKAQRNMGVGPTTNGGWATYYAVIHNAAIFPRNITLKWFWPRDVPESVFRSKLHIVGGRDRLLRPEGTYVFEGMQPGENRWIGVTIPVTDSEKGSLIPVYFSEMVGTKAVNGFAIAAQPMSPVAFARYNLDLHASVAGRIAATFELDGAEEQRKIALELLQERELGLDLYVEFVEGTVEQYGEFVRSWLRTMRRRDPFRLATAITRVHESFGEPPMLLSAHAELLQKSDAFMTMLQKGRGDTADIPQNVRWQIRLFETEKLAELEWSKDLIKLSLDFLEGFSTREITIKQYPHLIESLLEIFFATAEELGDDKLVSAAEAMQRNLDSPTTLQRSHRSYLLRLQEVVEG